MQWLKVNIIYFCLEKERFLYTTQINFLILPTLLSSICTTSIFYAVKNINMFCRKKYHAVEKKYFVPTLIVFQKKKPTIVKNDFIS